MGVRAPPDWEPGAMRRTWKKLLLPRNLAGMLAILLHRPQRRRLRVQPRHSGAFTSVAESHLSNITTDRAGLDTPHVLIRV